MNTLVENTSLKMFVTQSVEAYLSSLGAERPNDVYKKMLEQFEEPLVHAIMKYTRNNQSKGAIYMGLSRGTFRKLLKKYGLL